MKWTSQRRGVKSWFWYIGPRGDDLCGPGGSGAGKWGFGFFCFLFCGVDWPSSEREHQFRDCWIVNPLDDEVSCNNCFSSSAISLSNCSHQSFQLIRCTLSCALRLNVVFSSPVTLYS